MTKFTIADHDAGHRLDKYLGAQLPDITRSQLQKRIKRGDVTVNGRQPSVHQFLKTGDAIIVRTDEPVTKKIKKLFTRTTPTIPDIPIIADTDDYLVINKPAGVIVHDAPGEHGATVVDFVVSRYPSVKKISEAPIRPGIVHRIDKEVSGLLVIAKTQDMFEYLKSQFKSRDVEKWYYALVEGAPEKTHDTINFNIDRSTTTGHKMAAVPVQEKDRGKEAATEFEVITRYQKYTLLQVRPHTGRTHQIRVHLNAYGLPIVGDPVYRPKKLISKLKPGRIFLHAYHLAFTDLHGQQQRYEIPLPADLRGILDRLR